MLQREGNFLWGIREGYFRLYPEEGQLVKSRLFSNDTLIEEAG